MKLLNWVQWVSLFTTCVVVVTLPLILLDLSNAHVDTNNALRQLVCSFEQDTLKSPKITAAQKRQVVRFYDHALAKINEPPC